MIDKSKLLSKKRYGDYAILAEMLTNKLNKYISPMNAGKLIERENAKNHKVALETLNYIIKTREQLFELSEN